MTRPDIGWMCPRCGTNVVQQSWGLECKCAMATTDMDDECEGCEDGMYLANPRMGIWMPCPVCGEEARQ